MLKVHTTVERTKHFSITSLAGEGTQCPFCKAAATHPCFEMRPNEHNLTEQSRMDRMPMHTVHIERVRAMGHNVYTGSF